ncbi:zinc finger CCCH domain-containing protein 46 [Populus alba]|uniref:Zinc finger CCCH domain-containing protein 53-like n=1 Tax=Populus alba TaxID=43335 RepID=A0A4U5QY92_POPAL|nr:zinc finger CCCH domain-containing protein 53-like [Populus alba]TKS16210.1 zinc finger CCCH domain-containing protein 53-like [Populus alba]
MDSYEAANMVFSRIQNLEPENASKIMGYLLLQDYGEKEMIRFAFGPEKLLHNLILYAKTQLGFLSNKTSSSPFIPSSRPCPLSIPSSRITNNNGFDITNPSSPSTNSWHFSSPNSTSPLSYANVVNGASSINASSTPFQSTVSLSNAFPYSNNNSSASDLVDEYELQDRFSFLNDSKTDGLFDPRAELATSPTEYGDNGSHKRSFSEPDTCVGSEDSNSGFGWKPCLYFSRGFCKNGSGCRFVHGDSADTAAIVGSPGELFEFEQCLQVLRSKAAAQQKKLAAASQFMAGSNFLSHNKSLDFLHQQQNDSQRSAAVAALMMGDELHKSGRIRPGRNDFSQIGLGGATSPSSRQIYLTFPADSTFREEDVSNYFSIYGPVQDVRIPYQQKRMFGFVTFVFAETVRLILAKGNPHFVCDSRVLVKPYKEKGKVPDKKHHQQQPIEREEYSACPNPSRFNSREPFDLHIGATMVYSAQEMLSRKLKEEADLQQAIEFQGRRLLNLQLLDLKNNSHHHQHQHRYLHGLITGSPPSPTILHSPNKQTLSFPGDDIDQDVPRGNDGNPDAAVAQNAFSDADKEGSPACDHNDGNRNHRDKEEKSNNEESYLHENLEHILPDNLFASPKKSAGDPLTVFSAASVEADENTTSTTSSSLNMTSLNSCSLQKPRLSSGPGTIGI